MSLPIMPMKDTIVKKEQNRFRGLNHNLAGRDGDIYDMTNMSARFYPAVGTRKPRYRVRQLNLAEEIYGLYGVNQDLFSVESSVLSWNEYEFSLFKNGTLVGSLSVQNRTELLLPRHFAVINDYLVIFPDKKYYKFSDETLGDLEAKVESVGATITGKSLITFADDVDISEFYEGDAITLDGFSDDNNNKSVIIDEIDTDNRTIKVYENVLHDTIGEEQDITVVREVPDLDFICESENRIWGCNSEENTVYASKLGSPFNFNYFNGLSTDSFQVQVGTKGEFTACYSYLGFPIFFKEDMIYKMYGTRPENYQLMSSATMGVKKGGFRSLAVASETLFYLSKAGIVAYTGATPTLISVPLGELNLYTSGNALSFGNIAGGSDGSSYYATVRTGASEYTTYVCDPKYNSWHIEDNKVSTGAKFYAYAGKLYGSYTETIRDYISTVNESVTGGIKEGDIPSSLVFVDYDNEETGKKAVSNILLRLTAEPATKQGDNATVTVKLFCDSEDEVFQEQTFVNLSNKKKTIFCKLIPRRCDHYRIEIHSTTAFVLYSIAREFYSGSEL